MHRADKYSQTAQSFGQFGQIVECLFTKQVVVGSSPVAVVYTSDYVLVWSEEFLDI